MSATPTDVSTGRLIDAGEGNDNALGSWASDTIYMGAGNDLAQGLAVRDVICGQDGADLIEDTQGAIVLLFQARAVNAGWVATFDQAKGARLTSDGYVIRQHTLGTAITLAIYKDGDADNTVYLKAWKAGQFGISLSGEAQAPEAPATTPQQLTTREENNKVDHAINNDAADGGQGNDIQQATDAQSVLWGVVGNDILDGRGGADWLDGGTGNGIVLTGAGKDVAYGGSGNDVMRVGYTFDMQIGTVGGAPGIFYQEGGWYLTASGSTTSQFSYQYRQADGTITTETIAHPELAAGTRAEGVRSRIPRLSLRWGEWCALRARGRVCRGRAASGRRFMSSRGVLNSVTLKPNTSACCSLLNEF